MKVIFARLIGTALGLGLYFLPAFASAAINLPFSTTYNCAEQKQGSTSPTWVTCDGISKAGDWTTSNGSKEQITTAANYPGGGGGRGQRHWIGNLGANNSGSISYSFSAVNEIYVRWYARFQSGMKMMTGNRHHKMIYFDVGYFEIGGDFRFVNAITGTPYGAAVPWGWTEMHGSLSADGQWHWFEIRLKSGAGNGIAQMWVDGVLRLDRRDISLLVNPQGFRMPENMGADTSAVGGADMYVDVDDVAIQTTGPIGPLGGTPPPPPGDTSAPSAPSGLTLSAVSSSQINLTWTASTDNVGVTGYLVEHCSGSSSCSNFSQVGTSTLPSYQGTGLSASTTYSYRVRAQDAAGNLSSYSTIANATTQSASTPPPPVANLLFEEKFENANISSRGWYDNTTVSLSTTEHLAGSTASLEYRWTPGSSVPINGASARHLFTPTDAVYASYWLKYSANWVGQNQVSFGHHEFYLLTDKEPAYSNLAYTHLTAYIEENNGVAELAIQDGANIDETKIGVDLKGVTENRAVSGCNGTYPDGYATLSCYLASPTTHWNGKQWRTTGIYFDSTPGSSTYKNNWHHIEVFFKMNSIQNGIGQQDGFVQYWYDSQLVIDHQNVVLRTGNNPTMKFNQFIMAPYMGNGSPVDQSFWIDDLTLATSRPTTVVAVPAAPGNLTLQ